MRSSVHGSKPETSFLSETCWAKRTLRLVHVVPCALSSQDIFDFLLLHVLALEVALVDYEVVRAGEAFEAVLADVVFGGRIARRDFGDAQHVAACWADCRH
jgi:hypothetical protein